MLARYTKSLPRFIVAAVTLSLLITACAPQAAPTEAPAAAPTEAPAAAPTEMSAMDALVAAAQAEGMLTTIALPDDWCNYREVIDTFKAKYSLEVNELNPDVQPTVPQDWADLLDPAYKGQVALSGDPRTSNQAIQAVFASGLANGGSLDDAQPGLDFFAQLNAGGSGNFVPVIANNGLVAKGETPVRLTWDYNGLAAIDSFAGNPAAVLGIPASRRFGGVYVQAVSAHAPHPNAATLWMEFLYSDEGQTLWLKGYCHPIRYEDLLARKAVPQDLLDKLPEVTGAVFPSLAPPDAAKKA